MCAEVSVRYRILYQPSHALLEVQLDPSEAVVAEADSMVSMSSTMRMDTGAKGGLLGALKRSVGGESMLQNTFTAESGGGTLTLAPTMVGDIAARRLVEGSKQLARWQTAQVSKMASNVVEFLTAEQTTLVQRAEMSEFAASVATAGTALAQLESRIARLERPGAEH